MEPKTIIYIILSVFASCSAGFFYLNSWIRSLSKDMEAVKLTLKDKVSYDWFEKVFKKELKEDLEKLEKGLVNSNNNITQEVIKLTSAIIGTVETKGMLSKVHEHESRIKKIEDKYLKKCKDGI